MAGRDRENESFFRENRRDWINDRATRRDGVDSGRSRSREREKSPLKHNRDSDDSMWDKDKFGRDALRTDWESRRSRSIEMSSRDRRSRDRDGVGDPNWDKKSTSRERDNVSSGKVDWDRDHDRRRGRRYSSDRDRENSPGRYGRDRDRSSQRNWSPIKNSTNDNRSYRSRRSRGRSVDKSEPDRDRWTGRDRFGRDRSRNRDRRSPERSVRNDRSSVERDRSPKGRGRNVDNWGRELRLGGTNDRLRIGRASPDKNTPTDRKRSVEKDSNSRNQLRRSRERDWKKSVDDFLGSRGSRGSSPSSRPRSRDKGRDSKGREGSKWADPTEQEWDREIRRFEREKTRSTTSARRRNDDDRDRKPSPKRSYSSDQSSSREPRRTQEQSPKHKPRDRTPVVDEKSDGEDMVISDDDNHEDGNKLSNEDWENLLLQKYKSDSIEKIDYQNSAPQKTIVVRCMPPNITEVDIHLDITSSNLVCHDIRLVRRKDTGSSRGFAFVEFYNIEDAVTWMEMRKGILKLGKGKCFMEYSLPRDQNLPNMLNANNAKFLSDWICNKCQALNFSKRFLCYVCNSSRMLSDLEGSSVQASEHPTNTVVLLGLDILTTEETVLKSIASLSNLPIRSVKIARDSLTNISKGACYLEMNNVQDAFNLYSAFQGTITQIDGKLPDIKYARLDSNRTVTQAVSIVPKTTTVSGKIGNAAIAAAQWSHQSTLSAEKYTLGDVPKLAEYSASLYATTPQEKVAYFAYYENYYKKQISEGNLITLPVNSAAGLANAQANLAATGKDTATVTPLAEAPDGSGSAKYPRPDTSLYQYDPSSGFYYDPFTKLYYDSNSQYYYNSTLRKYLYWDSVRKTYLPTPSSAQLPEMSQADISAEEVSTIEKSAVIFSAPQVAKRDDTKKEKEIDNDRVKVAKRIAKDMEKWAKTLNQKKESLKQTVSTVPNVSVPGSSKFGGASVGAADIGFAVLERKDHLSTLGYYDTVTTQRSETTPSFPVFAPQPTESDDEDEISQEEIAHTDWDKLICLLCKRQLGSREALIKHQQMSDLHKQNLSAWYRARGLDPDDANKRKIQYRDRASERRLKYGLPDTPKPSRLKETYIKAREAVYVQPTTKKIGSDNMGNKLLQKMGWQEGMGLGKSNQGRTSIIEAGRRPATAGLGSRATGVTPGPGESYKDCVKKMMALRYAQLDDQS